MENENPGQSPNAAARERFASAVWAVVGLVGLWLAFPVLMSMVFAKPENVGIFGDMYGALNALFSGFALLGVVYAVLLQRKELQLQRAELELTRAELKRTAEAQIASQRELGQHSRNQLLAAEISGLSALIPILIRIRDAGPEGYRDRWMMAGEHLESARGRLEQLLDEIAAARRVREAKGASGDS